MIEVQATHPNLSALFDRKIPNNPILFATLMGHTPGRAWVDDPDNPSQCVVRVNGSLVFISTGADQAFLEEGFETIKQFSHVVFVWRQGESTLQIPKADRILQRLEFTEYDAESQPVADLIDGGLADGFEIRDIDKELVETLDSREDIENYCGSLENFLAHGFGICLMQNGEIVSEAYAPFVTARNAELATFTRETHRGHGYATKTCAHFLKTCRKRGLEPYWSCDADNLASVGLARKLGFRHEREYEILLYRGAQK
jgi:RimJ/RimL family protein N-acetyltransferase